MDLTQKEIELLRRLLYQYLVVPRDKHLKQRARSIIAKLDRKEEEYHTYPKHKTTESTYRS